MVTQTGVFGTRRDTFGSFLPFIFMANIRGTAETEADDTISTRDIRGGLRRRGGQQAEDSAFEALPLFATLALAFIVALAFSGAAEPSLADRLTLLVLGLSGALCFWTPLLRFFEERADAATFALTLAMFVVYGMARRAAPTAETGWVLQFPLLPDDTFAVSWAARVAVLGALISMPLWLRHMNGWTRAILGALAIIAALGLGSFAFLRGFYTVGATEVLNPKPLADTLLQIVEYGALALLCSAVCAQAPSRRRVLRLLPLVLLALWVRHQFFPAPPPPEDE